MQRPKAYSYIRMSTPDQLQGDSLRRQLARTKKYADENGLEIVDRFDDLGVSAYRGHNIEFGALKRFRELVDSGEIPRGSYLIVESMDRLSRDKVMKALTHLTDIVNRGITLVTLDDKQEYSEETLEQNAFRILIALGAMSRAHEESRRKSGLLSDVWEEKKRKTREEGAILTRRMPAWLTLDPQTRRIVAVEERAKIVREIFTHIRDGWGAYSLARQLNKLGHKSWSELKNAVWRESYIKKIINSRTVLGEYQPHRLVHDLSKGKQRVVDGPPIVGYYPAVISEQLFTEARLAMSRRKLTGRGRKGTLYSNLFTGLLRCNCSAGYRYINKGPPPKGGQYLQCTVAFAKGPCSSRPFRYQIVESALLEVIETIDVERVLGGPARKKRIDDKRYDLAMLQIEAKSVEEKISHVLETIASDGALPRGRLKQMLDAFERDQEELLQKIDLLEREIGEMLDVDPAKRQEVINGLLAEIRAQDGSPKNVIARRALVAELQRMIEVIVITPHVRVVWEVIDEDSEWKKTYKVRSVPGLDRLLREVSFDFSIRYRSGDLHQVDALKGVYMKSRGNRKMNEWRLMARAARSPLAQKP